MDWTFVCSCTAFPTLILTRIYFFLSIILVKSEKILASPCISVHLPHGLFFLPIQCKYKPWQNAVLGTGTLPYSYTALLMQSVTQRLALGDWQRQPLEYANYMGSGANYLLFSLTSVTYCLLGTYWVY